MRGAFGWGVLAGCIVGSLPGALYVLRVIGVAELVGALELAGMVVVTVVMLAPISIPFIVLLYALSKQAAWKKVSTDILTPDSKRRARK